MEKREHLLVDCYVSTPSFLSLYACDPNVAEEKRKIYNEEDMEEHGINSASALLKDPSNVYFIPSLDHSTLMRILPVSQKVQAMVLESVTNKDRLFVYSKGSESLYYDVQKALPNKDINFFSSGYYEMGHFPFMATREKNLGPKSKCYFASEGDLEIGKGFITFLPGVIHNATEDKYVIEIDMSLNGRDYFKTLIYKAKELVFPESDMIAYT